MDDEYLKTAKRQYRGIGCIQIALTSSGYFKHCSWMLQHGSVC